MAAAVPTIEPTRLTQGDTTSWTKSVPDYAADDGWALDYYWTTPDGTVQVTVSAPQDGTGPGFLATIDAAAAALFTALGVYKWRAVSTKAAETVTVDRGDLEILDPLTGATDRRLWLEKMLAALEAKSLDRASEQQLGYSIEGRSLSLMSLQEVMDVRKALQAELEQELHEEALANGERRSTAVKVRLW